MEEQHHYDLRKRSRSRSHTPMIFNQLITESETSEHHYDLRSRESRERSMTPAEVSSSRRSNSRSLPNSVQKSRGKGMDAITEKREEIQSERDSENEYSGLSTVKKVERRSERQRVKRQLLTNGQSDEKDHQKINETDHEKRKSLTPRRTITSDYSSEEGEREDLPSRPGSAYEIYKQAGDWWNVFPKTDYTYSRASQCRYEIAPGVLAMPNMSRPSIHSDESSTVGSSLSLSQQTLSQTSASTKEENTDVIDGEINDSIEQNRLNEQSALYLSAMMGDSAVVYKQTHVEKYSRQRFIYQDSVSKKNRFINFSQADSDAELDEAIETKSLNYNESSRVIKWFKKSCSVVVFLLVSVFEFIKVNVLRRENINASHDSTYQNYKESRWTNLWSYLDQILQFLYLMLIRVLYLDSWILSRATWIRQRFLARRTKVFWLILLPPLLLAGFWLLPYMRGSASSELKNVISKDITKRDVPVLLNFANQLTQNLDKNASSEEIRHSLAILIDRVEKLEAANANQGELISNFTQTENDKKISERDAWIRYEEKLLKLEEKLNVKTDESTNIELQNIKLEFKNLQEIYKELKTCCNKAPTQIVNNVDPNIEKHVQKIVTEYLGTGVFESEIHKIVESVVKTQVNQYKEDFIASEKTSSFSVECEKNNQITISDDYIRNIVRGILKIYDADKTGRVDYALESAGGQVISIRCTQRYNVNTRAVKLLGFTLFYESGDPRTVIQGHNLQPGVCWAFQDFPGYLLIKLRNPIKVTGFTMEHAPRSILPNNEMKSAPRKFNVWGLKEENDISPVLFGEYEFIDGDESLQYFPVNNLEIEGAYEFVELRIHSNHGQLEYTCLYRFRIHGVPIL